MSPDPKSYELEENLDILGDDDRGTPNKPGAGGQPADVGFDINIPNQNETDDEIADVDVSDEADEGPNAAEALRAQVNAEEEQQQQETSSSSSSSGSGSSGSGSGSGSSSSDSDGSDDDSASSGGDIEIWEPFRFDSILVDIVRCGKWKLCLLDYERLEQYRLYNWLLYHYMSEELQCHSHVSNAILFLLVTMDFDEYKAPAVQLIIIYY